MSPQPAPSRSRPPEKRRRRWRLLLVPLVALILSDLAISTLLIRRGFFLGRPIPPFRSITNPSQLDWLDRQRRGLADPDASSGPGRFDPVLGWSFRPGFASKSGLYRIGALGSRGPREYAREKPEGTLRILCFGDSFTYCDEVPDRDAWPALLEAREPELEAINFGVSGYGTDQALMRFRREGRELGADVVLIGMLLENVGRNANRYRALWHPWTPGAVIKPRYVLEGGELVLVPLPEALRTREGLVQAVEQDRAVDLLAEHEYWLRRPDLGLLRHSGVARVLGALRARQLRDPRRLWSLPGEEPYRVTLAILETFQREALEAGARRAPVLLFPREATLRAAVDQGDYWWRERVVAALEERGIDTLDACSALVEPYRKARERSVELFAGSHLDRRGNAVVAEAVREWLRREGLR